MGEWLELIPSGGVEVVRSAEWRPSCGQCWRFLRDATPAGGTGTLWVHDDGTPQCPQGTADAVRGFVRALTSGPVVVASPVLSPPARRGATVHE